MTINRVTNYCEELKYKNPYKFAHVLPILGRFHIEMSFMSVIVTSNNQRFSSTSLTRRSLERAIRLIKLFYKAMLRILISHGKKNNLVLPTHLDELFKSVDNTD